MRRATKTFTDSPMMFLPVEMTDAILLQIPVPEQPVCRLVCKTWSQIIPAKPTINLIKQIGFHISAGNDNLVRYLYAPYENKNALFHFLLLEAISRGSMLWTNFFCDELDIKPGHTHCTMLCTEAARSGSSHILRELIQCSFEWDPYIAKCVSTNGDIETFKFLLKLNPKILTLENILPSATENHLELFHWQLTMTHNMIKRFFYWLTIWEIYVAISMGGNIDMIKWFHEFICKTVNSIQFVQMNVTYGVSMVILVRAFIAPQLVVDMQTFYHGVWKY